MDDEIAKFMNCLHQHHESKVYAFRLSKDLSDRFEAFCVEHEDYAKSTLLSAMVEYCLNKFE